MRCVRASGGLMTTDLKKDLSLTFSTVIKRFSKSSNHDLTKLTMAGDMEILIPTGATDLNLSLQYLI